METWERLNLNNTINIIFIKLFYFESMNQRKDIKLISSKKLLEIKYHVLIHKL